MKTRMPLGPLTTTSLYNIKPRGRFKKHFGYKHPKLTKRQIRDMVRRYFRHLPSKEALTYAPIWELGEHIAVLNRVDIFGYARGLNLPIIRQIWDYLKSSSFLIVSKDPDSFYSTEFVKLRKGMRP